MRAVLALGGGPHRAVRGLAVAGQGAVTGHEGVGVQPVPRGLLGRGWQPPPHHDLLQSERVQGQSQISLTNERFSRKACVILTTILIHDSVKHRYDNSIISSSAKMKNSELE